MANAADIKFAQDMIPHHQAAVDMGLAVVADGEDPEINSMARSIIEGQSAEIGSLKAWLAQNGAPESSSNMSAPGRPTAQPSWAMKP